LFFAAADNLFADLHNKTVHTDQQIKHIVLQCDAVTVLDAGGIHALTRFVQHMLPHQQLHLCNVQFQPMRMLVRSQKTVNEIQQIQFSSDLESAFDKIRQAN
ncbi:TPA: STAS domain-containing protein, partial [Mannheimia haemolytica]|nr:STAS domain-containing protein [Mannheimia haemolytica]HDV7285106.1 STAS domain-containing protein [Mannheimia haemolytica]